MTTTTSGPAATRERSPRLRVEFVGRQRVILSGLRLLFEQAGFVVVGVNDDHHRDGPADVVVVDVDGAPDAMAATLTDPHPPPPVVVLLGTSFDHRTLVDAFRQGARGAVLKSESPETVIQAVRRVAAGEVWLDTASTTDLVKGLVAAGPDAATDPLNGLSRREREVATLVARGLRNRDVGERLGISVITVRNHVSSIFRKTGASSRLELALCVLPRLATSVARSIHAGGHVPPTDRDSSRPKAS